MHPSPPNNAPETPQALASNDSEPVTAYYPEALSDISLTLHRHTFKLHKQVLCLQSRYFHNLLISDLTHKEFLASLDNNTIELPDSFNSTPQELKLFFDLLYNKIDLVAALGRHTAPSSPQWLDYRHKLREGDLIECVDKWNKVWRLARIDEIQLNPNLLVILHFIGNGAQRNRTQVDPSATPLAPAFTHTSPGNTEVQLSEVDLKLLNNGNNYAINGSNINNNNNNSDDNSDGEGSDLSVEMLIKMLDLCHYFDCPLLSSQLETYFITSKLFCDNEWEMLAVAERCHLDRLRHACLEQIKNHPNSILDSGSSSTSSSSSSKPNSPISRRNSDSGTKMSPEISKYLPQLKKETLLELFLLSAKDKA